MDACFAQMLRDAAETCDAVTRHGVTLDERAPWLAAALTAARAVLTHPTPKDQP